ncbi:hypothetical protein M703_11415 [Neisseria gonorrhoeae SK29344]|nr:hypothetical protein M679_10940 [Neisseria gonorrhoeae SK7842]KLR86384.1 hypothetical protein M677_05240 [Neisseria gonorrhoeae SK6987]KLS08476.1 hypothetical protein M703_11415 [Neisseria gonorrhoeae SK29344]
MLPTVCFRQQKMPSEKRSDGIFCAYLKSFSTLMKICVFLRV